MKKTSSICITILLFIQIINAQTSWKGTTSTNWSNTLNWTAGVPTATIDAIIGDGSFTGAFQPVLTATAACKSLTIGTGAKVSTLTVAKNLTVSGNVAIGSNGTILHNVAAITITIKGNWANSGTYSATVATDLVTFSGAAQSLTGATTFQKIGINAGSTLTLANNIVVNANLSVSGTLDPTASYVVSGLGTLNLNSGGSILVKAVDFTTNYSLSGAVTISGTGI
jgi:fibronectin-binding autotransporter adhesin